MRTGGGGIGLLKRLEQPLLLVGGNAGSCIANPYVKFVGGVIGGGRLVCLYVQCHRSVLRKFDGVGQKVQAHLMQPRLVGPEHRWHLWGNPVGEFYIFLGGRLCEGRQGFLHAGAEPHRLALQFGSPGLQLRKVENVVDDGEQGIPAALNRVDELLLLGGQGRVFQQFGKADDPVHGGANLVAHVCQKLAFGLCRRQRVLPGGFEFLRAFGHSLFELPLPPLKRPRAPANHADDEPDATQRAQEVKPVRLPEGRGDGEREGGRRRIPGAAAAARLHLEGVRTGREVRIGGPPLGLGGRPLRVEAVQFVLVPHLRRGAVVQAGESENEVVAVRREAQPDWEAAPGGLPVGVGGPVGDAGEEPKPVHVYRWGGSGGAVLRGDVARKAVPRTKPQRAVFGGMRGVLGGFRAEETVLRAVGPNRHCARALVGLDVEPVDALLGAGPEVAA